jgi:hypothetical protein
MAEMLLINPKTRGRRKARRSNPIGARKTRRASARRRNPIAAMTRRVMRRRNPIGAMMNRRVMRRRRNPIGMGRMGMASVVGMVREGLMSGVGAVAFGVVHGQIQKYLPDSLKVIPGKIGAGDAVKALITVVLGQVLSGVTRGYSKKAAAASLTVQMHDLVKGFVPATLPLGGVGGLGYMSPAGIAMGTNRVGPIRRGMNAYTQGTPLLSAYTSGGTQLLNGARSREGVTAIR